MHRATRALYRSSTLCAAARTATIARHQALRGLSSYDNPTHHHLEDLRASLKKQLAQHATDDAEAQEMDELLSSTFDQVKKENLENDDEQADTTDGEALHVLFPRKGHFQASMEIKKRILYSTPHMKGERLKLLARRHSRHGTVNSFIADLEGRLDRFIYRLNLVPSIFAARHEISVKHILVNGRPTNRPAYQLKPMDVVEVKPGLERHFLKHIRRRLQNNTFNLVLADAAPEKDDAEAERASAAKRKAARSKAAAESQLVRDIAEGTEPLRLRRLPPPKAEVFGASTAELDQSSRLGFDDFGGVLLAMLPALATGRASSEIKRQQRALSVSVPPQKEPDAPAGIGGSSSIDDEDDRAPLRVLWRDSVAEETVPVLTLDRARVRRLMLALLALKSP